MRSVPPWAVLNLVSRTMLLQAVRLLIFLSLVTPFVAFSQNNPTKDIPKNAHTVVPKIKHYTELYWSSIPVMSYPAALAEHESCISLTHSRCFSATSEFRGRWKSTGALKEQGSGILQITRTWREDGTIRFDAMRELIALHPSELKGWGWNNVYDLDYQARAIVLKLRDNYKTFSMIPDPIQRLKFVDVSYNQGVGGTVRDRKVCGLTPNCDPKIWDDNVERTCTASKAVLYGRRSACNISRDHVKDVFNVRLPKYKDYYKTLDKPAEAARPVYQLKLSM